MNETTDPLRVLSLGAGVQSSALALMAAHGEIEPPEFAVFADTQAEPRRVYEWLDWLEARLPFPVIRVTAGNLGEKSCEVRTSKGGNLYIKHSPPVFIHDGVSTGLAMRQCTLDFKVTPILREINARRHGRHVIQYLGISYDEAQRMRRPAKPWITNSYPLVERVIRRHDCIEWMRRAGYPEPPRSACVFCPYRSDAEWLRLREESQEDFNAAVRYERNLKAAFSQIPTLRGTPYLHRSLRPLADVDFDSGANDRQAELQFGMVNECDGMCGS